MRVLKVMGLVALAGLMSGCPDGGGDNSPIDISTNPVVEDPTATQTAAPSPSAVATPTAVATPESTQAPSAAPTLEPTPSVPPTSPPTLAPTPRPTSPPTLAPTLAPTSPPTLAPTSPPTLAPTSPPTLAPTAAPTATRAPTPTATRAPTPTATRAPTPTATRAPTPTATRAPTPTPTPTRAPTPTAPTDADGDGYPAAEDCDDSDAGIHPGADEHCDESDEDCDGVVDEGPVDAPTWYGDADGDGYGGDTFTQEACTQPENYVDNSLDCDDLDAAHNPETPEVCDDADQDCDDIVDEDPIDGDLYYPDEDGDGYGVGDGEPFCAQPVSGYAPFGGDCDDLSVDFSPGAEPQCDEIDDDCDGDADEAAACIAYPWQAFDDVIIHRKDDGAVFTGKDCPANHFGLDITTVEGVAFAVGPYTDGDRLAGLPHGGVQVSTHSSSALVNNAYLIFPGGRCTDQSLDVTFIYDDGSTAGETVTVPWDCSNVASRTGTYYTMLHQGNYSGDCCNNWYWASWANPRPDDGVDYIQVTYSDGCGGQYNGQIWGLTVD